MVSIAATVSLDMAEKQAEIAYEVRLLIIV